jgi:hypothetical protein
MDDASNGDAARVSTSTALMRLEADGTPLSTAPGVNGFFALVEEHAAAAN